MTPEIIVLLVVLGVMVWLFLSGRLPIDLTALLGLVALTLLGLIEPRDAFAGFSSPAVMTMIAIFFISGALRLTGVDDLVGRLVHRFTGRSEMLSVLAASLMAALLSAFINNVAATALLLPAVMTIARRAEVAPSRLLIPLAFGTIFGGMLTMIGTAPNIIMVDLMRRHGVTPFGFLEFTPAGLALTMVGILIMVLTARFVLPENRDPARRREADLPRVYRLYERLFVLTVPPASSIHGFTLGSIHFGDAVGAQVVAIERGRERILSPQATEVLQRGDRLIVGGRREELDAIRRFTGLSLGDLTAEQAHELTRDHECALVRGGAGLLVEPPAGVVTCGRIRAGILWAGHEAVGTAEAGDELLVLGAAAAIEAWERSGDVVVVDRGIPALARFRSSLFTITIPAGSPMAGLSLEASRLEEIGAVTLVGRATESRFSIVPREVPLAAGETLIVSGDPRSMARLTHLSELELAGEAAEYELETAEMGLAEVVLAPRSKLIEATLGELNFRERYGFQVLAVWRNGAPIRSRLSRLRLQFGDALLLQGPRERMALLASDPDFVLVSDVPRFAGRGQKAHWAVGALAGVVLLSAFGVVPVEIAAFLGVFTVVLSGAIRMDEAYREIEWRVVFFVAAILPLGGAFERAGAAAWLAGHAADVDLFGPWGMLLLFMISASLLSQLFDGVLSVVLLGPVAIKAAEHGGISPEAFLMGIALAASIAFLTPFSHKANLLVMAPGGYRSRDYFVLGSMLTVASLAVLTVILPLLFPF